MGEQTKKDLLVIAVTAHDPYQDDHLKAQKVVDTAPDVSAQLSVKRKEKFEVLGRNVGWWLYVRHVDNEEKGYIPSTCVVPLKNDLTHEEEEELSRNVELTADLINLEVDLKFFPAAPVDEDITNRGVCPEENANIFSKATFWWLNGLIYQGYKRPLVDGDLWALGKRNKSVNIVPKFMKKWAKEEKRCAMKRCPTEEHQEQEKAKLKEENEEAKVEFVPKNDKEQSNDKKTDKERPSLVRVIAYQFGSQFLIGMILLLIFCIIQFIRPRLVNLLVSYVADKTIPSNEKWKGYVYAFLMFLVSAAMSLIIHHYWQIVFVLSMRIRTAIVGMVYAKALALNSKAREEFPDYEIERLISVDVEQLVGLVTYGNFLWSLPLVIMIAYGFLLDVMGLSTLASVGGFLLIQLFQHVGTKIAKKMRVKEREARHSRIEILREIIDGVKVLKLYAWEKFSMSKVFNIRKKELKQQKNAAYFDATSIFTFTCVTSMVAPTTFAIYVLTGNELTAIKAFVALSLFDMLSYPMAVFPHVITSAIQGMKSVDRLTHFLNLEELDTTNVEKTMPECISSQAIHVEEGSFGWDKEETPFLSNIDINIPSGSLVAVVGHVGCGKTTLLSALFGETEKLSGKVYVKGSVAYVPQNAWIQNTTLRDNILFGRSFDSERYRKTISTCALETDLDILPGGDMTEIGKGDIYLSKGQEQRISLARSVYFDADVYLLDDPLSAVDSNVTKHIFDKVIGPSGKLGKKTRIFVTREVGFLPEMDQIILLQDGRISEVGTYSELLANKGAFSEFLKTFAVEQNVEEDETQPRTEPTMKEEPEGVDEIDVRFQRSESRLGREDSRLGRMDSQMEGSIYQRKPEDSLSIVTVDTADLVCAPTRPDQEVEGKIIEEEKSLTGRVKFAMLWAYVKSFKVYLALSTLFFVVLAKTASVSSVIWLARWSSSNVTSDQVRDMYLRVYGGLGSSEAFSTLVSCFCLGVGSKIASRYLHQTLLENVLHSPMSFFETTPETRIVDRFRSDIRTIDDDFPFTLVHFLRMFCGVLGNIVAISFAVPISLFLILSIDFFYFLFQIILQRVFVANVEQFERFMSMTRSPISNFFYESINGASTIRTFAQQQRLIRESYHRVDKHHMAQYPAITVNRWLALRLEFLGVLIILSSALFTVYNRDVIESGSAGLSITCALQISCILDSMVRMSSKLETNIASVKRVKEYSEAPTEAEWIIPDNRPPENWPNAGNIVIEDFDLKYREGLPLVLKQINCDIQPREKIGIVGRTGAGKSALTLALFRILERAGGRILIDGVDISKIGLQDLRSRLTIIPKDPVLFSGTLRLNLDPFDSHTDEELWKILELSHLKNFVSSLEEGLLYPVSEGGRNLSVSQQQLVCLARALLRKSKVLVLDEATAAVDRETAELIQQTISREFADCTVLNIADRLDTIMDYTRIMVLDKGFVAEFDSPEKLLTQRGKFYSMAQDAGLT